jgi:Fe-S-cluster containining protein
MANRTPAETRAYANVKMDEFFNTVPSELKAQVVALPQKIQHMNARPIIKLKEVLNTADKIFEHAGKFAACARGCGHCCHVSVPITEFEAQMIAEGIGVKAQVVKQSKRPDISQFGSHTPCPFLANGECSIYEVRPLTCRMHMNFDQDNYWCLHENWQKPEAEIPRPNIQPLEQAYHMLPAKTKPIVADIRDFFPRGRG